MRRILILLLLKFTLLAGSAIAETQVDVYYVRTGDTGTDNARISALGSMISILNSHDGGQANYTLYTLSSFSAATAAASGSGNQNIVVAHGVYSSGSFTGDIADTYGVTAWEDVAYAGGVTAVYHCGMEEFSGYKITVNDIGSSMSARNSGGYPYSGRSDIEWFRARLLEATSGPEGSYLSAYGYWGTSPEYMGWSYAEVVALAFPGNSSPF